MYLLIPLLNIIGLELVYLQFPHLFYVVSSVIIVLTLFFIYRQTKKNKVHRLSIMISVITFLITHYLLMLFLEGSLLIQSFIILSNFALFIFLYIIYDRCNLNNLNIKYALENIIGYFNLAIFFFLSVDVFYLELNSNYQFIWFFSIFAVLSLALIYSSFDIFNLIAGKGIWYIGVILLIMVEFFWVVALLPISVYSKAGILSVIFYMIVGLSKHYLIFGLDGFSKKIVWRYLTISSGGLFLILLTTRW